ncbi:MAG: hypothetical protein ABIJ47_01350 [Candidatus Bathyarchaeota archaeon]
MKRILALSLLLFMLAPVALADEPRVRVETFPHWTAGDLAIYLMEFPGDGATYSSDTIRIRVAVWGTTKENPVKILLNGEEAARIEGPGMFTYEWSLRGSYHLLIRCETKIFQQAAFNVKAPPPPAPVILLDEFYAKLEQQRSSMMMAMVGATVVGVPVGVWFKRKTKITTAWATIPMGMAVLVGIRWLPDFYMFIPLGLSAGMVYWLARGYATEKAVNEHHESGLQRITTYPFDDEGRGIIVDAGPQYWRTGFIKTIPLVIEGKEGYLPLEINGVSYPQIITKGDGYTKTDKEVKIKSDWSLAQAFAEARLIEKLQKKVAEMELAQMLMNRALPVVVVNKMKFFEATLRENILSQTLDPEQLHVHVKDATKKLTEELQKVMPAQQQEEAPDGEG